MGGLTILPSWKVISQSLHSCPAWCQLLLGLWHGIQFKTFSTVILKISRSSLRSSVFWAFLFFVYAFILQGTSSNNSLRKSAWEVNCLRPCTSKTSSFYSHALIEMWVRCSFLIEFWKHCSIFFCLPEMLLKSPMLLSLHLQYVSCLSLCGLLESSLVLKVYDDVSDLKTVYIHVLSLVGPFNLEQWWQLWPSLCFMATSGLPMFL